MRRARTAAAAAVLLALLPVAASCGGSGRESLAACPAIRQLFATALRARVQVASNDPAAVRRALASLVAATRALDAVAPPRIRDNTHPLAQGYTELAAKVAALGGDLRNLTRDQRFDLAAAADFDTSGRDDGENVGDYAELRCGFVGGYDVTVAEVRAFCPAYQRYHDVTTEARSERLSPRTARILTPALERVGPAAPAMIRPALLAALDRLGQTAAGDAAKPHLERASATLSAVDGFAEKVCALD